MAPAGFGDYVTGVVADDVKCGRPDPPSPGHPEGLRRLKSAASFFFFIGVNVESFTNGTKWEKRFLKRYTGGDRTEWSAG
jgi:hypothetical protein